MFSSRPAMHVFIPIAIDEKSAAKKIVLSAVEIVAPIDSTSPVKIACAHMGTDNSSAEIYLLTITFTLNRFENCTIVLNDTANKLIRSNVINN